MKQTREFETRQLFDSIIEGLFRKKGENVIELNLKHLDHTICDYFIICQGHSYTQVQAIAESVESKVKEDLNLPVWHKEGLKNSQWVLLDYTDIVVHIFQEEYRAIYNLEELWADAEMQKIEDVPHFNN